MHACETHASVGHNPRTHAHPQGGALDRSRRTEASGKLLVALLRRATIHTLITCDPRWSKCTSSPPGVARECSSCRGCPPSAQCYGDLSCRSPGGHLEYAGPSRLMSRASGTAVVTGGRGHREGRAHTATNQWGFSAFLRCLRGHIVPMGWWVGKHYGWAASARHSGPLLPRTSPSPPPPKGTCTTSAPTARGLSPSPRGAPGSPWSASASHGGSARSRRPLDTLDSFDGGETPARPNPVLEGEDVVHRTKTVVAAPAVANADRVLNVEVLQQQPAQSSHTAQGGVKVGPAVCSQWSVSITALERD